VINSVIAERPQKLQNSTAGCCYLSQTKTKSNKIVKPSSRLSTARGSCLWNVSWIQANWFKQHHAHRSTHTQTHVTLIS